MFRLVQYLFENRVKIFAEIKLLTLQFRKMLVLAINTTQLISRNKPPRTPAVLDKQGANAEVSQRGRRSGKNPCNAPPSHQQDSSCTLRFVKGNVHAHILLSLRQFKFNGEWDAKYRKEYDLDGRGQRIPDGKGGWKNHRVNLTDWNEQTKAEKWRAAWATLTNQALEKKGLSECIDHRSYKRQGIEQIPTIHMGVAASQMEKRGIVTEKGTVNREIAKQKRLLKEIASLFAFLQSNGIRSMSDLHERISTMQSDYYALRGEIVKAEQGIAQRKEYLTQWERYTDNRDEVKHIATLRPKAQEREREHHNAEIILYDASVRYLAGLKERDIRLTPKRWKAEIAELTASKDAKYQRMYAMRDQIKAAESIRKAAERLEKQLHEPHQPHRSESELQK